MTEVHESMKDLEFLIGRWQGTGTGLLSNGPSFQYTEELIIENIGQPNFAYSASSCIGGKTRHRESGFIKCHEDNKVVFCIAENLGSCSILLGALQTNSNEKKLHLTSDSICRSPFNKEPYVVKSAREYLFDGEKLHLIVRIATTKNTELTDHLKITYERKSV